MNVITAEENTEVVEAEVVESVEEVVETAPVIAVADMNASEFGDFMKETADFFVGTLSKLTNKEYTTKVAVTKDVTLARAKIMDVRKNLQRFGTALLDAKDAAAEACMAVSAKERVLTLDEKIAELQAQRAAAQAFVVEDTTAKV